jgi:hypothetical protein
MTPRITPLPSPVDHWFAALVEVVGGKEDAIVAAALGSRVVCIRQIPTGRESAGQSSVTLVPSLRRVWEVRMSEDALAALTQVAAAGATTLVTAMATDLWREVRERVAGLLARGDGRREALQRQLLEESRRQIQAAAAGDRQAASVGERVRWEAALRQALVLNPDLALDLAVLVDEVAERLPAPAAEVGGVQLSAVADGGSVVYQAGRDLTQNLTGRNERPISPPEALMEDDGAKRRTSDA